MGLGCLSTSFFFLLLSFIFPCVFWWHWQQQLECLCLCPALSMEDERTDGRRETGSDKGEAPDWSHRLVVATAATTTTDQIKARYLLPPSTVCVSHRIAWRGHSFFMVRRGTARRASRIVWISLPSTRPSFWLLGNKFWLDLQTLSFEQSNCRHRLVFVVSFEMNGFLFSWE